MITITDKASEVMQGLLEAENKVDHVVRICIMPGGCSGYEYKMNVEKSAKDSDIKIETAHGSTVVVDPESMKYVQGCQIDYLVSQLGGQFTFSNPKATSTCGCGKSFSVEDQEQQAQADHAHTH